MSQTLPSGYLQQVANPHAILGSQSDQQISDGGYSGAYVIPENADGWPELFLAIKFETYGTIHPWARVDVFLRRTNILGQSVNEAPPSSSGSSYVFSRAVAGSGSTPTRQANLMQIPAPRDGGAIYLRPVGCSIGASTVSVRAQYRSYREST